jgi:hypothetical protein
MLNRHTGRNICVTDRLSCGNWMTIWSSMASISADHDTVVLPLGARICTLSMLQSTVELRHELRTYPGASRSTGLQQFLST